MNRDQLLASLTAGLGDLKGISFDDESYIDWSCPASVDDPTTGRNFEFGDEHGDAVGIEMTWDRIERLQRALTLLLLERDA